MVAKRLPVVKRYGRVSETPCFPVKNPQGNLHKQTRNGRSKRSQLLPRSIFSTEGPLGPRNVGLIFFYCLDSLFRGFPEKKFPGTLVLGKLLRKNLVLESRNASHFTSQWARRDRLMSRGKNCRETIFVSHLSRNYPHRGVNFERG